MQKAQWGRWLKWLGVPLLMIGWGVGQGAPDIVVDRLSTREGGRLNVLADGTAELAIVRADQGVSRNFLERLNSEGGNWVINNSREVVVDAQSRGIAANPNLDQDATTILLEAVGSKPTVLKGLVRVLGGKAKLIIVNTRGIVCDGCSFDNVTDVELRTDDVERVVDGRVDWIERLDGEIKIGHDGIKVFGGLTLAARQLKIDGDMLVDGKLAVFARPFAGLGANHFDGMDRGKKKGPGYLIEINAAQQLRAEQIQLIARGTGCGIKMVAGSRVPNAAKGATPKVETPAGGLESQGDLVIEAGGNVNLGMRAQAAGDLKIIGKGIVVSPQNVSKDQARNRHQLSDVQLLAGGSLELSGDKIDLKEGVRLRSDGDSLRIGTGKLVGAGDLMGAGRVTVFSRGGIAVNQVQAVSGISLVTNGDVTVARLLNQPASDIRVHGKKLHLQEISGAQNLVIYGKDLVDGLKLKDVNNVDIVDRQGVRTAKNFQAFSFAAPLHINGSFKFVGRDLQNHGVFQAGNIALELTGDFINSRGGELLTSGNFSAYSRSFTNQQNIEVAHNVQVISDNFVNGADGKIRAGSIDLRLVGKAEDGNAFVQRSSAKMETTAGGIELVAPFGGVFLGGQVEAKVAAESDFFATNEQEMHAPTIHIQSGGDLVLDGTQLQGRVVAEAMGGVQTQRAILNSRALDSYGASTPDFTVMEHLVSKREVASDVDEDL